MTVEKPKIFVIKTSPKTVLDDYKKLMHMAEYDKFFLKDQKTVIKLNLSWSKFFSLQFPSMASGRRS